jgi:hypothetical protein
MKCRPIPLDSIVVRPGRRSLGDLSDLMESITRIGLLNPITVTTDHRLVAGASRLAACKRLGWVEIPAHVVTLDDIEAELAEIDENLIRNELTVLQRGEQLVRRKELYLARYPQTKRGGAPGKAGGGKKAKTEIISAFAADWRFKFAHKHCSEDLDRASSFSLLACCAETLWGSEGAPVRFANLLRWFGPPRAADFGLRAEVERAGAD